MPVNDKTIKELLYEQAYYMECLENGVRSSFELNRLKQLLANVQQVLNQQHAI